MIWAQKHGTQHISIKLGKTNSERLQYSPLLIYNLVHAISVSTKTFWAYFH